MSYANPLLYILFSHVLSGELYVEDGQSRALPGSNGQWYTIRD